jgi:hypothetical protein
MPKFIENQSDAGAAIIGGQEVIRMDEERSYMARIVYATEAFLHKNKSNGNQTEPLEFESVEQAKNAPFPEGFGFAHMSVADGYHVYSPKRGWIFYG